MHSSKEELERISAETKVHTRAARASCEDTREHIVRSRIAIQRSLELLGWRFNRIDA